MEKVYKIKKSTTVPMLTAVILSIPVFADVLHRGMDTKFLVAALTLIILFYLLTLNNLLRKITITEDSFMMSGLMGPRQIKTDDITFIDGVTMGSRQFVTISTKKRDHIITNSFDNFGSIIDDIAPLVDDDKKGEGLFIIRDNIINRRSDSNGAWIAVIILALIIVMRFFTEF